TIRFNDVADVTFIEVVVVGIVICGAIATVFANSNLAIILITGITGYGVAILFVLYRAPDLALTQLVIETVSIVLFLLVYRHLPKLKKRTEPVRTNTVNLIISIGFGVLLTLIGISAHSTDWFESISQYFVDTALSIG